MSLNGKVAIVTGSSKGLGASIALKFAEDGAALCLTGRNKLALDNVASTCQSLSPQNLKPLIIVGDLTQEEVRMEIYKLTLKKFRKLDILVNNAGVMNLGNATDTSLEEFDQLFDINFRAPYDMCRKAIPHLVLTKGCIINMSSVVSCRPNPVVTPYCISKAALDTLTSCLACELGPQQIRVLSVNPAVVSTDLWKFEGMSEEACNDFMQSLKSSHALGRLGTPEEVSKVIAFLASDSASFITGSRIMIDGGSLTLPPKATKSS